MTGASQRLRQIIQKFEPDLKLFRDEIKPKIEKLKEFNAIWGRIKGTFSKAQLKSMNKYGYATMNKEQIDLVYKDRAEDEETREFVEALKG
jgi:hypothetical protein